jgi:hypothetical protein
MYICEIWSSIGGNFIGQHFRGWGVGGRGVRGNPRKLSLLPEPWSDKTVLWPLTITPNWRRKKLFTTPTLNHQWYFLPIFAPLWTAGLNSRDGCRFDSDRIATKLDWIWTWLHWIQLDCWTGLNRIFASAAYIRDAAIVANLVGN